MEVLWLEISAISNKRQTQKTGYASLFQPISSVLDNTASSATP